MAMIAGLAKAAPPATLNDVVTWVEQGLTGVEDWPILGFDDLAVTFGSPTGATLWDDGLVEGDIRQEFFEPVELDGHIMRSAVGRWTVDCARQRYAVLRMTLYAQNNLKGQLAEREVESPVWIVRNKLSAYAIEAMCQAARKGPPPTKKK